MAIEQSLTDGGARPLNLRPRGIGRIILCRAGLHSMQLTTHFGSWRGLECARCSRRRISFAGWRSDYLWARARPKDQHDALLWASRVKELASDAHRAARLTSSGALPFRDRATWSRPQSVAVTKEKPRRSGIEVARWHRYLAESGQVDSEGIWGAFRFGTCWK